MTYVCLDKNIVVYNDDGGVHYSNKEIKGFHVFENGNLVIVDESSIVFVTKERIQIVNNLIDYAFTPDFVIIIEKRYQMVCASIFGPDLVLKANLYLMDSSRWTFVTHVVQLVFPFATMEVTGFEGNKLYGVKGTNNYCFDLNTRTYLRSKHNVTNIVDALQSRFIKI